MTLFAAWFLGFSLGAWIAWALKSPVRRRGGRVAARPPVSPHVRLVRDDDAA